MGVSHSRASASIQSPSPALDTDGGVYSTHPLKRFLLILYGFQFLKVEFAIILFMAGRHLYSPLYQQYYYHVYGYDILKNTSFLFPNGSFCISSKLIDNYTGNNDSYKLDELFSNHLVMYGQLANSVPSVLMTLILGPLTDKFGRKIGIILPAVGTALQGIFTIFIVTYSLDPYFFILANFISGMFGDFTSILSSSFAYVADSSSIRWRSLRIGLIQASLSFGSAVGFLIVGLWLHRINCDPIPPLWTYVGINLFIVVYMMLCVPDSLDRAQREKLHSKTQRGISAFVSGVRLFLGSLSPKSTWALYMTTLVVFVAVLNIHGSSLIEVYFLKALPFDFNSLQVGIYQTISRVSKALNILVLVVVLVFFSISDVWIMLVGLLSHCSGLVLLGFSNTTWQLYSISVMKGLEEMCWAGARAHMSKLVKPEEQGGLFSVVASVDAIGQVLSGVIWPIIFPLTLDHKMRPGTTFFFMAAIGAVFLPLILSLFFIKSKSPAVMFKPLMKQSTNGDRRSSSESSSSEEEEYQPLLTKSWTSNKAYSTNS